MILFVVSLTILTPSTSSFSTLEEQHLQEDRAYTENEGRLFFSGTGQPSQFVTLGALDNLASVNVTVGLGTAAFVGVGLASLIAAVIVLAILLGVLEKEDYPYYYYDSNRKGYTLPS